MVEWGIRKIKGDKMIRYRKSQDTCKDAYLILSYLITPAA
jgi:hypothetical protein